MSRSSGQAKDFWYTLFGNRENEQLEQELETYDEQSLGVRRDGKKFKRPSLYVKVFEDMVNVIMEQETHLLSDEERDVLKVYRGLDYRARYLLVRLALRQPDWHALSSLQKYSSEIGEEELEQALRTLCIPIKDMNFEQSPPPSPTLVIKQADVVKKEEAAVDLTLLDDEEPPIPRMIQKPTQAILVKPSIKTSDQEIEEPVVDPFNLKFDYLFRDQSTMTVKEALTRLTLPDLREISKSMKVGTLTMRKETLINAMINHASDQHTLPSLAKSKGKGKGKQGFKYDGMVQTQLSFGQKPKSISQLTRLREMVMEKLGPCVKINPNLYWLVGRLHIISYRGTEKPTKYCLPALLAGFKKWNFPDYIYERTGTIWPTREDLLEYEEALFLDVDMENPPEDAFRAMSIPAEVKLSTLATPTKNCNDLLKTPQAGSSSKNGELIVKAEANRSDLPLDGAEASEEIRVSLSIQRARHIKKLYQERIEPKWKELLARKDQEKGKVAVRTPGLERFEAGHVYTRMVHKAASAFGMLKEWHTEFTILEELLQQTHWRKGKRAAWYERRALILERYIEPYDFEGVKNGILQALADDYTGIVNRPSLARRLERIQKKMKLHPEKWIVCDCVLENPVTTTITAKRSDSRPGVKLDHNLRPMKGNVPLLVSDFFSVKSPEKSHENDVEEDPTGVKSCVVQLTAPTPTQKRTGKSSWVGFSDEAVDVETYALQHYEMIGYVGFHSETRILTTIFALIFWDIIFSGVPGAFETPFQAGPLDMFEDSFYLARRALFEQRLEEVRNGKAKEYLKRHDDRYRLKQTWCIGLRWDVCEQKQLLEIVECLGAKTLALICQLFCEDYAGRCSGVPDLIVWKLDEGICKFVEVKGPGDNPKPNQRLWFDSLLRAGANVEVCRVIDQDAPEPKKRKRKTPKSKKGKEQAISNNREGAPEHQQDSDDDADYLPLPPQKRRKIAVDHSKIIPPTPTLMLTNAPPSTPPSGRRARSMPPSAETTSPSMRHW